MEKAVLSQTAVLFALALALALLIERFIEILKAIFDLIDSRFDLHRMWTRRAERARTLLVRRLRVYRFLTPDELRTALNRVYDLLLRGADGAPQAVPTISGDLVRAAGVKVGAKAIGIGLGVWAALYLRIDIVRLWPEVEGGHLPLSPEASMVLTGVAIGLGSGPLHKVITAIERRRARREAKGGVS